MGVRGAEASGAGRGKKARREGRREGKAVTDSSFSFLPSVLQSPPRVDKPCLWVHKKSN